MMKHGLMFAVLTGFSACANAQTLTNLGVPPGWSKVFVRDLNDLGTVVVGYGESAAGERAFRWTSAGGFEDVASAFGAAPSDAMGVSPNGVVVVGFFGEVTQERAFRWTSGSGMQNLGLLPGGLSAKADAVSGDMSVVVGYCLTSEGTRAFRWSSVGGMQDLGRLPGSFHARAYDVSSNGAVIVGSSGGRAFRYTQHGGMVALGRLPGQTEDSAIAHAVNSDGSAISGHSAGLAFRWTEQRGMHDLGRLPDRVQYSGFTISGDGQTVGGIAWSQAHVPHGFLWRESIGMVSLKTYLDDLGVNTSGWNFQAVYGLSSDGRTLAGTGQLFGAQRGFIVTGLPKACRADMNGDGVLNIFDFIEFQNLFAAENFRADFNYDGQFDIFDFLEFQNAFAAGCP